MNVEPVASWLYAVIRAEHAEDRVAGLRGVAGEPVRAVIADVMAAAVGTVGIDEFGSDALRRNLEDLDWLAAKARAHDAVISAIASRGPVIPVRMATLYVDDERVRQLLTSRRDTFDAVIHRLSGREEFGVKVYADAEGLAPRDAETSEPGGRPSGTAYLLRRRRELASQEETYQRAAEEAARIHETLMRCAVDGKRKPALDKALSGTSARTVLNGTYLVDHSMVGLFRETVAALDKTTARITLEVTGPWPPYSFVGDFEAV